MGTIYYLCGNGLEFELKQFEDKTYALYVSYTGDPDRHWRPITIKINSIEARDQMLKEIQTFAETTAIRLRNAKDEV